MRYFFLSALLLTSLFLLLCYVDVIPLPHRIAEQARAAPVKAYSTSSWEKAKRKAQAIRSFAASNGYDSQYCFLVDMSIHSGKNRFFVYRLDRDSIEYSGLVTHGSGSDNQNGAKTYSNRPNSHCTSLGRYKIGHSYMGKFGLAYKLYGLDAGNSMALQRFVVLHGHECVPDGEVYPLTICLSLGCPTVSPAFLTRLQGIIDQRNQPVLIWIYDQ